MNRAIVVAFAVFAALSLAGCTKSVDGQGAYAAALSATAQHERTDVTAAPAPTVPSTGIPKARTVDEAVQWLIKDLNQFWDTYGVVTGATAKPESKPLTCPDDPDNVSDKDNAVHCIGFILYSPEGLAGEAGGRRYVVAEVIAHEVGHTVEQDLGQHGRAEKTYELAADCLAGMYMAGKGIPLSDASDDFTHTGMYQYAGDEALSEFQRGYRNFSPTDLTFENVKLCIPKDH